jgi:hypothetical protein
VWRAANSGITEYNDPTNALVYVSGVERYADSAYLSTPYTT